MTFISRAAPFASYRAGKQDEAIEIASRILEQDPYAAEAHMCLALIHLRRGAIPETAEALRNCANSRSGEWILERLRADFGRHGVPPLSRDLAMRLGAFFRSNLSPLGPALAQPQRKAQHDYTNVVGTSYVRSFGGNPAFFPLFIGMGPTMLLLTEETTAITRRKFAENLKRVDSSRHTLLVLNGDAYYHATNFLKLRETESPTATEVDLDLMDKVAERHEAILSDARKQISGRVLLLCSTPTFSPLMDQLSARLNQRLGSICERNGVTFLDWYGALSDPTTGHLRHDYSANAYPRDVHFSLATTELFISLLKGEGIFAPQTPISSGFEWTHVFDVEVEGSERTRIWCEPSVTPNNAFQSHKIAASHLGQKAADLLCCFTATRPEQTLAMVNVRDGYMPIALPPQIHSGCIALTDTSANLHAAQMVLDFYGRSDVQLGLCDEAALDQIKGANFDYLLLAIHAETTDEDERRCNEFLARVGTCPNVLIMTPFPQRIEHLQLNGKKVVSTITVSNRHLPEVWRNFTIFIAR